MPPITPKKFNPLKEIAPKAPVKLKNKLSFSSVVPGALNNDPLAQAKLGTKSTNINNISPTGTVLQPKQAIAGQFEETKNNARKKMADSILNKTAIDANTLKYAVEGLPEENKRQIADMVIESGIEIIGLDSQAPSQDMSTSNVGTKLARAGAGILQGAADVGGAIGQGLAYIDPTITVEEYKKGQENIDKSAPQAIKNLRGTESFGVGKEIGKIAGTTALTRPIGGGAKGIGLLGRAALGATDAIVGQAAYNVASGNDVSEGMTAAGLIGGGIPVLGKGVSLLKKGAGSVANKLALKGLLNTSDARIAASAMGGDGSNIADLGGRLLEKGVVSSDTAKNIARLDDISKKAYDSVRNTISNLSDNIGSIGKNEDVANAMNIVAKNIDAVNNKAGYEAISNADALLIQKAAKEGNLTLSQAQEAKELIDEFVKIYKKSGEVGDTQIADLADKLRKGIRKNIEDTVTKATNGATDIGKLNKEVAIAKSVRQGIAKKEVANAIKEYVVQGGIGGIAVAGAPTSIEQSPEWIAKFILGSIGGRILGGSIAKSKGPIAKALYSLSKGSKEAVMRFAKAGGKIPMSKQAIDEISEIISNQTE